MYEERRMFIRFPATVPMTYLDSNSQEKGDGETRDLSAKGVGFVAYKELQPGTMLEIWLKVPDRADGIYSRGEVVWSRRMPTGEYRVGVNLEKVDFISMSHVLKMA